MSNANLFIMVVVVAAVQNSLQIDFKYAVDNTINGKEYFRVSCGSARLNDSCFSSCIWYWLQISELR